MATAQMQNHMRERIQVEQQRPSIPFDEFTALDTPSPFVLTPSAPDSHSNHDYLNLKPFAHSSFTSNPHFSDHISHPQPNTPLPETFPSDLHQHSTPSPSPPKSEPAPFHTQNSSTSSPPEETFQPASSPRLWPEASVQPDQQLTITLFSARDLEIDPKRSGSVRPYAVLEFDQTESVTEDALGAQPENGSNNLKRLPKWRGFKRAADGSKSPIHASRSGSPLVTACEPETSRPGSRLYASSTSRSRTPTSSAEEPVWNHTATFDILEPSSSLFISIYDRSAAESDGGFLGGTIIDLEIGGGLLEEWIDLWDAAGERCCGAVKAKIEFGRTHSSGSGRVGLEQFEVLRLIGEGSYGQVFRVRKKDTRRVYAMKVLDKQRILRDGKQTLQHVLSERAILVKTRSSPFLVGLKFSFQTTHALHLVMDLKPGGELMSYMQRYGGRFPEPWVVFYTAEILSGLSFLHSMDIIYRDLKPENCLLDATGHVALCDFGLSKLDMKADSSTRTFCGTTEYIAPEILMEQGYTRAVDFWSLGVLIFEMTVGWTPFFSEDRVTKYSLILESDISAKIPKRGVDQMTREIILRLLERDPAKRLGGQAGAEEAKDHGFFRTINWTALVNRRLRPPFRPRVESDADLSQRQVPSSSKLFAHGAHSRRSSVDGRGGTDVFRHFTFSRNTSGSSLAPMASDDDETVWQTTLPDSFMSFGYRGMDDELGGEGRWDHSMPLGWTSGSRTGAGFERRSSEIGYLT
ncbi:hypothetical protein CROQUDRAFT_670105 [Cronartium quercuum f. sp. fusiforme G11]|uniref:Uncharacterized protein n=1 Tax=Cronartium quercuum f. sp. fusiforme G11 TaxID=708437 RepID=A0A9P6NJE4_9BASI|nr:hypothetical protein CROQUDRAFT_670105 [Cronartium quercuum f. sp. fusiforme G11]